MRTTLELNDTLVAEALESAPRGITKTALIEDALRLYIQRHSALVLRDAGGSLPMYEPGPRRKTE